MPAVTVRHRAGCDLPHPGPGFKQWLRWTFSTVRCEGTRRIGWLGIDPCRDKENEEVRLIASQLAYLRGADEFHGAEAHTDQHRARSILARLDLDPDQHPRQVARVASQLAYLRGADEFHGADTHTDQHRARTILAAMRETS